MHMFSRFTRYSLLLISVIVFSLIASTAAFGAKLQLAEGEEIQVRFASGLTVTSGTYTQGDSIPIVLDQPISIGGKIVVESGALGTAVVVEGEPAGSGGKPGKIKIAFVNLETKGTFKLVEGDKIQLSGETELYEGKGKGFFPWLFLKFILKGSQATVPTTVSYPCKVAETVMLKDD